MHFSHWRLFIISVIIVVGIFLRFPLLQTAFAANIGWVAFQRVVLGSPPAIADARSALNWFSFADENWSIANKTYEQQILRAWIGANLPVTPSVQVETNTMRQSVRLWANLKLAIVLADGAEVAGHIDQAQALRTMAGFIDQTMTQSVPVTVVGIWGWQGIYQLVALSQKAGRSDLAEIWVAHVRSKYPGTDYAYLRDLHDPYAQSALSDAYASLGLIADAVRIGEQALAIHNWDWGHFVIAGYYRQLQRWTDAEVHLLAAVAGAENGTLMNKYRLALADLYRAEGMPDLAIAQLCHVLTGQQTQNGEGNSEAQSMLAELGDGLESCSRAK